MVHLPNSTRLRSTHTAMLKLPQLTHAGRTVRLFRDTELTFPLLSVGQFCDADCTAHMDKHEMRICDPTGACFLRGERDRITGLYLAPLPGHGTTAPTPEGGRQLPNYPRHINMVIRAKTEVDQVRFGIETMGSPTTPTVIKAVAAGFLTKIPGMSLQALRRHPPDSIKTAKGHLHLNRQGRLSTKQFTPEQVTTMMHDAFPGRHPTLGPGNQAPPGSRHILTRCIRTSRQMFTDLSGQFPFKSTSGNEYMMLMYDFDANYIHVELMTSRGAAEFARAYTNGLQFFRERGCEPEWMRLDDEQSRLLTAISRRCGITTQICPPSNHRSNPAERAIATWKDHFISVLSTVDPDFPMEAWDKLVPQAELTLNLLRASRVNPAQSAWAALHGPYDFLRHPMAPAGTKVLVFETSTDRATWDPHGVPGFYVGPAMAHYRCYDCYVPRTKRMRTTDTVSWHPADVIMPGSSVVELLTAAVQDLSGALATLRATPREMASLRQPLPAIADSLSEALQELRLIFAPTTDVTTPTPTAWVQSGPEVPPGFQPLDTLPTDQTAQRDSTTDCPLPLAPRGVSEECSEVPPLSSTAAPQRVLPPVGHAAQRVSESNHTPSSVLLPRKPTVSPTPQAGTDRALRSSTHPAAPARPLGRGMRIRRPKAMAAITTCATDSGYREAVHRFLATSVDLDDQGRPLSYNAAMQGPDRTLWEDGQAAEWTRLVDETKCLIFVAPDALPAGRKASYHNPQPKLKVRAGGHIEYRIRSTYGGDKGDFHGPTRAETADMSTLKILLNATVSEGARFMTIDIRDFYLGTPLDRYEYMWVPVKHLPMATRDQYKLHDLIKDGKVLAEVHKGIYGLKQAGRLAQLRLLAHLAAHGYHQAEHTPCLFVHDTLNIKFVLTVDDFGVKYHSEADVGHLIRCLEELYTIRVDWAGTKFVGFTITHDRARRTITVSMPGYMQRAVTRFNTLGQADNPGEHVPLYRRGRLDGQALPPDDTSPLLSPQRAKRIQEITGVVLYYARAVDPTLLTACAKVASKQAHPTEKVEAAAERLLRYAAKRPEATLVFHASDMRLITHSDASYLSESGARSRVGGMSYLGNHVDDTIINGAIHHRSTIIDCIVGSAAEAEYAGLYTNGQHAEGERQILDALGYPQEATLLVTDNSCAAAIANDDVTQRRSKSMDMRFHWIRDRVRQGHFQVTWRPGNVNLADLFTKDHPTSHFLALRPFYVTDSDDTVSTSSAITRRFLHELPAPRKAMGPPKQKAK
jgi:hypothetical protein